MHNFTDQNEPVLERKKISNMTKPANEKFVFEYLI